MMTISELKRAASSRPVTVQLLSHEGGIYLCQINHSELLTAHSNQPPIRFNSIEEARDALGNRLSAKMELVLSSPYDEMINL
ncbi:MAG: DUF6482 family protein [Endozoicomonas sp.]